MDWENPKPEEQIIQRSSHTVSKILGPTWDFNLGIQQRDWESPRESDLEGHQDLITEFPQDWGKQRLVAVMNKTLCAPGPRGTKAYVFLGFLPLTNYKWLTYIKKKQTHGLYHKYIFLVAPWIHLGSKLLVVSIHSFLQ